METLRLYYPARPFHINQVFGANADYYAKFHDSFGNPLKGHDGVDLQATHGTPLYASMAGMARFSNDAHGGQGITIRGLEEFTEGFPVVIHWHMIGSTDPKYPSPIPLDFKEYPVKIGDFIGWADNTGAPYESSGDHCHLGLYYIDQSGAQTNLGNGFNGRVDPQPFFTGTYAQDVPDMISKLQAEVVALQAELEALMK